MFIARTVSAQTSPLERLPLLTLEQKLAESKNDTNRVQIEIAIGRLMLVKPGGGNKELDAAMRLSSTAEKLSRRLNYNYGIIHSMLLSALGHNRKNDIKTGLHLAEKALAYAQKVNDELGIAESYIVIGQHYNIADPAQLLKRLDYYQKASSIFRKQRNYFRLATSLQEDAELLFHNRRHMEAIKMLFEAINVNKAIGNQSVQMIYWLIGRTMEEFGDFPNALKYSLLALKTADEVKDTTLTRCSINYTIASVYTSLKDYERATSYVIKALEIARHYKDQGYTYTVSLLAAQIYSKSKRISQALNVLKALGNYDHDDANRMLLMGIYLSNLTHAKRFKEAEAYAKEVRRLLEIIPADNFNNRLSVYNFLAFYYIQTRQIKLAYLYADQYAAGVKTANFPNGVRSVEKFYYQLDSIQGNFESANKHYLIAQGIKDSIDNVTKAYQISMLHIENETEKKINDIDTLTKQAQAKDDALKRNQLIQKMIIAGLILLTIITALIYSRYRLKQKNNLKLEANQRELDQKNLYLESMNIEQEKLIKEKEWLIKEVHHRVKNNLQMVTSLLSSQSVYLNDDTAILAVNDSLRRMQAMSMIHQKLYQDDNVSTINMQDYVDELLRYLRHSFDDDNRIVFKQDVEPLQLDVSQAIPLGLIITESVVNAIKYAFLNSQNGIVNVNLGHDGPDHLRLYIADNGIGLPKGIEKSPRNSLGLDLMEGLAHQLKGNFHIENNNGVHITIRFKILVK